MRRGLPRALSDGRGRRVATGETNLEAMALLGDEALRERLMCIRGVGVKVANCVMLFAYHRLNAAPVDVWFSA